MCRAVPLLPAAPLFATFFGWCALILYLFSVAFGPPLSHELTRGARESERTRLA